MRVTTDEINEALATKGLRLKPGFVCVDDDVVSIIQRIPEPSIGHQVAGEYSDWSTRHPNFTAGSIAVWAATRGATLQFEKMMQAMTDLGYPSGRIAESLRAMDPQPASGSGGRP